MRPEEENLPELYYDQKEALKYTQNSRIQKIQSEMTHRAIELLQLPEDESCFLLDIGCGSGLSGEILEEYGHYWVGCDISADMLDVAREREVEGDLIRVDIGQGMPVRAGIFDGVISISCLQWLMTQPNAQSSPHKRLHRFFQSLYNLLCANARCVFQFYPTSNTSIEQISSIALQNGFQGGVLVDWPNSQKKRKYYLVLSTSGAGSSSSSEKKFTMPASLGTEEDENENSNQVSYLKEKRFKKKEKSKKESKKQFILRKKELRRKRGEENVPLDSKYTARKRQIRF